MTHYAELKIDRAAEAIISAARRNPNITSAGLMDEVERLDIGGWASLQAVRCCNYGQWSAAMVKAAEYLRALEERKAAASARRAA